MKKSMLLLILMSVWASAYATQTITARVNGMVCAFCAQGIEKKARALPETEDVYVNLKQKIVAVQLKEGKNLSADTVKDLIKDAGYDVTTMETTDVTAAALRATMESTQ
jgi:cation transport ATPase